MLFQILNLLLKKIILIKTGKIIDYANVNGLCDKYNVANLEDVYMKIFGRNNLCLGLSILN